MKLKKRKINICTNGLNLCLALMLIKKKLNKTNNFIWCVYTLVTK